MARFHTINGARVQFTAEEETARDIYEAEWETQQSATKYIRERKNEYPSVEELTVALYDTDDKAALEAKRAAIKKKWPKDNSGPVE